jgi:hypothetical protein
MATTKSEPEPDFTSTREGVKTILCKGLARVAGGAGAPPPMVDELELAAYNSSLRAARAQPRQHRQLYMATVRAVNQALGYQVGPFPDEVLGLMFLRGDLPAAALVEESVKEAPAPDPREVVRRLFMRTLMGAHKGYAGNRDLVLATAREIEVSCYNAAVRISKESEDPPRRQWDSPAFVDIYGTRCGTINGLLDPDSSACQAYGAILVPKILAGAISPAALGDMSAKDLCPQATVAERAEIAKRVVQKVQMKESTLFRCPHCNERRCTYQEVQRRSLDEAPDYLCLCLSCDRRFTGRG